MDRGRLAFRACWNVPFVSDRFWMGLDSVNTPIQSQIAATIQEGSARSASLGRRAENPNVHAVVINGGDFHDL